MPRRATPLQDHDWVRQADNLELMQQLPAACCDLIYADPPFFTGKKHTTTATRHHVADQWPGGLDDYLTFIRPRLEQMHRLLKPSGTLYVHLDWHVSHYVKVMLDEIVGYENFLNEIIWSYRTGGRSTRWHARKHDTILSYAHTLGQHTFHTQRDGQYRTDGMNYDEDGRPYKSTRKGRLYFHPDGPTLTDVWEIPFLSTVATERTGYPTQKPERLLERIIVTSSNVGDVVADFFCGSGTTLTVAKRLERRYIGCDRNPDAVKIAQKRLGTIAT